MMKNTPKSPNVLHTTRSLALVGAVAASLALSGCEDSDKDKTRQETIAQPYYADRAPYTQYSIPGGLSDAVETAIDTFGENDAETLVFSRSQRLYKGLASTALDNGKIRSVQILSESGNVLNTDAIRRVTVSVYDKKTFAYNASTSLEKTNDGWIAFASYQEGNPGVDLSRQLIFQTNDHGRSCAYLNTAQVVDTCKFQGTSSTDAKAIRETVAFQMNALATLDEGDHFVQPPIPRVMNISTWQGAAMESRQELPHEIPA